LADKRSDEARIINAGVLKKAPIFRQQHELAQTLRNFR
jgi:hypothetical protein